MDIIRPQPVQRAAECRRAQLFQCKSYATRFPMAGVEAAVRLLTAMLPPTMQAAFEEQNHLVHPQVGPGIEELAQPVSHSQKRKRKRKRGELNGQLEKWRSEAIKIITRLFPDGDYKTWSDC
ncbi:hypothetical protein VE03_00163 [Pseudogymnoascus sp. 23342-1-I1]|nr:hypothetical protein VE03_00163 [Pseudogymnoascus sp. 23342-1-I1]